ncbi:protein kinase domain-containing protein [Nonomuraea insulae]|uniref:non-specific serine/threonine protein kinase n=1 Tax=Nonomuraea insulae TaxID=1616787 RepID=A0ABW1CE02_9ACTN
MTVIAERVRGYQLVERAGQDGPWTVHLARSAGEGTEVLVKTLACHRVDKRALKRIVRGFGFPEELAAHESVIPVLEVGATGDGRPYLVTPPHDGLTLAERPGRSLPMPLEQATGLLRAVARAVAATHAAGGAHGRVKPENVVMTGGGVVLTGYAMSALMSIVELPDGTLPSVHASPEELEGHPPVPASDVYALASMAYELLAGRPAFALDGPGSTARFVLGVLTEAPPPLPATVPADLAAILTKSMSKDPGARPSADDLAAAASSSRPRASVHPLSPAEAGQPSAPLLPLGEASHPSTPRFPPTEASHPSTARLPTANAGRPLAARLSADLGQPLTARPPMVEGQASHEQSGPRELVWTVDPDRSQVSPPAGPQPFLPPAPEAAPASPSPARPGGRSSKVPLFVAGASALAVLVGVGSVALAMSARTTADGQPAAATGTSDDTSGTHSDGTSGTQSDGGTTQGTDPTQNTGTTAPDGSATDAPSQADQQPSKLPTASDESRQPDAATDPPARQTANPATVAAYRPKSLKLVSDNGTTVTLSWKAERKNGYPMIIQQAPGDRLMSATSGGNTYTVGGLDATIGYCFKVGSVVTLGQPSSVAWSSTLCIRGAAEASPQDDEVQPPIVLPLATPS